MKSLIVSLISISFIVGCANQQMAPAAGSVEIIRTEGSKTEKITYTAPQLGSGESSVSSEGFVANFSANRDLRLPEIKDVMPQRMLYGAGIVCALLTGGFAYFGHVKLLTISGICSACMFGLAVFINRFEGQIATMIGLLILTGGAWIGWCLWRDYKDDGKLNLSTFPHTQ